jgi:hypothetical protein
VRSPKVAQLAVVTILALVTPAGVAKAAPGSDRPDRPVPGDSRPAAAEALDDVIGSFAEEGPRDDSDSEPPAGVGEDGSDLTLQLLELNQQLDELSPEDRDIAEGYLARPTDGRADPEGDGYAADADPATRCHNSLPFCVTYARATADRPPATDVDANSVPDQVDTTIKVLKDTWNRIVVDGQYRAPLPDEGPSKGQGPDDKFDVYLADIGGDALYGYCNVDEFTTREGRDAPAFCVLDDDYSRAQFSLNTPTENLEVTVAHEFFHAVQFAYDFLEDPWFMEGSAAWIEDELYDDVNDNLQYLTGAGPLRNPEAPLDVFGGRGFAYASWIWWRYLTERFPAEQGTGLPVIMRRIWERAHHDSPTAPGTYSLPATSASIAEQGSSFGQVFADFGEAIRHPASGGSFEEGRSYPKARLLGSYDLSAARPSYPWRTVTTDHLTNRTVGYLPGSGLGGSDWKLRVKVDAFNPARGAVAQVSVHNTDGSVDIRKVKLDASGVGKRNVRFSTRTVNRVELTLTNAGRRYSCNAGTYFSCEGVSLDDRRKIAFRAKAFR